MWFVFLGENIGSEENGKGEKFLRPAIVLKKFNNEIFLSIPLTETQRDGEYYFPLILKEKKSTAILSQIRLIDAKRLHYKIGYIPKQDFKELKTKLTQLLA